MYNIQNGVIQMADTNEIQTIPNFATANDFANMLNGNYRTVSKILQRMADNKEIEFKTVKKNNRNVTAYLYNNSTIKTIQAELVAIRKGKKNIAYNDNANTNANVSKSDSKKSIGSNIQNTENVTIYEVTKANNELENKNKDLEIRLNRLEIEKQKIEIDYSKLQSEMKYIEDKSKSHEAEIAKLTQENTALDNTIKTQNKVILTLSTVIIVSLTILITISICMKVLAN